jgi:hypothetical protein
MHPARCTLVVLLLCGSTAQSGRLYHPVPLSVYAQHGSKHTHVEIAGFVTYVRSEADGDLHVRVCDSAKVPGMDRQRCMVAEFIPTMPGSIAAAKSLSAGRHVRLRGISRFDAEGNHGWWEIHPVERLVALP